MILQRVKEYKEDIRNLGVKRLALFGSYAKDMAREESDIDFLVEFEKGRGTFDDYVSLKHLLEDILEKEVDLVKPRLVREELKDSILRGVQVEAEI